MIIGIAGQARSGKDTLCRILIDEFRQQGVTAKRYAFADPIKQAVKAAFNLTEEHVNGALKEIPIEHLGNKSPRQIMQTFGTEYARRTLDNNIWINVAKSYTAACLVSYKHVIIPDVRFENEAAWIRGQGGLIIHIDRQDASPVARHVSEKGLQPVIGDCHADNNGSLKNLYTRAQEIICSIS